MTQIDEAFLLSTTDALDNKVIIYHIINVTSIFNEIHFAISDAVTKKTSKHDKR